MGENELKPQEKEPSCSETEQDEQLNEFDDTQKDEENTEAETFEENIELQEEEKKPVEKQKKKRAISYFHVAILMLLTAILVFQITYLAVGQKYQRQIKLITSTGFSDAKLQEINEIYKNNFVYDFSDEDIEKALINGYIYGTGDAYGMYYTAEDYAAYVAKLNDKSVGIGVVVTVGEDEKSIEVLKVHAASPADNAGVKKGDIITSVDGKSVADVGYSKAVDMMLGEIGQKLSLSVKSSSGETKNITVTRSEFTVSTIESSLMGDVAYIKITNFFADTPDGIKTAIESLTSKGAKSVLFDVRNNTGGSLTSIENVLKYLLPKGTMFRIIDKSGKEEIFSSEGPGLDIPMAVLVNNSTASAAELFTSALMDYNMAKSVGEKTYGKGSVSVPFKLNDGSYIYLTAALYYPPVSDNFDGEGIVPDHEVKLSEEASKVNLYKLSPEDDDQLQYALKLLNK